MDLTERGGGRRLELELREPGLPVGAQLRGHAAARTNGRLMSAADCNWASSAAYSLGRASGMVAAAWATFIGGPFRPPSARRSSSACCGLSMSRPRKPRAGEALRPVRPRFPRPGRSGGPGRKACSPVGSRERRSCRPGQLGVQPSDHALDDRQTLGPELGIGGVEAERRQQLLVSARAAGAQQLQVAGFEALRFRLVDAAYSEFTRQSPKA